MKETEKFKYAHDYLNMRARAKAKAKAMNASHLTFVIFVNIISFLSSNIKQGWNDAYERVK